MSATLWSLEARLESFFVMAFVTEFCGAFPEQIVVRARENSTLLYEQAVLKSSWSVWQALHLDYFDLGSLRALRNSVFESCALGSAIAVQGFDRDWLEHLIQSEMRTEGLRLPDLSCGVVRRKLESREKRLLDQLVKFNSSPFPSIFGETGFYEEAG